MNLDTSTPEQIGDTQAANSIETVTRGPSGRTLRLMMLVGLGAVGTATVASFTSMAGANTDPIAPRDGQAKPTVVEMDHKTPGEPIPEVVDAESPFGEIDYEGDPDTIFYNKDGEFYCPPCGMG